MALIEVGNAESRLSGVDREQLRIVRHHVAMRVALLPPIPAQRLMKGFFHKRTRYGAKHDLAALWGHAETADALIDAGVPFGGISVRQLEAVLRQRGLWDGWERLVASDGSFPTGLLAHVHRALTLRVGVTPKVTDNRGPAPRGTPLSAPALYGYQTDAVEAWLAAGRGVVSLPPRSGKTRIAVAAVAALGLPAIYVVPGVGLARQTVNVFRAHGLSAEAATGGRQSAKRQREIGRALVWVATPQTAAKLPGIGGRQVLILDEFHHAAAKTWRAVSQAAAGAWWRLGLTGTHYRADGRDMEMTGVLARAVYSRTVSDMVGLGRLVPARIAMLRIVGGVAGKSGHEVYSAGVVDHEARNAALTMAANTLTRRGRRVLVLAKEVRHAEALSARIPGSVQVDGRDNAAVDKALADLAERRCMAVVGTSVIGEGRDVPACDALVYAAGGKSRVRVKQDYFRALTASPGKRTAIIVDAADCQHDTLTSHAAARLRLYRSEGCFNASVIPPQHFPTWLESDND